MTTRLSTIARRLAAVKTTPVAPAFLAALLAGEPVPDASWDSETSIERMAAEGQRASDARDTLLSVAPAAAESGVVLL